MASIEKTPPDQFAPGRQFITRNNKYGVGIDVGWRFAGLDIWWGNTRDAASLRSLVADAWQHGYDFRLSPETAARLAARKEGP